jgi:genome maintenance exonuclease 1
MTFAYQPIEAVTDPVTGIRVYKTPAGDFSSITTMLGQTMPPEKAAILQRWRDSIGHAEADAHSKKATDHGTMVHLLIERHLLGEPIDAPVDGEPVPLRAIESLRALKMKLKKINSIWAQEQAVWSPFLKLAGRFDCMGEYEGVPTIIDFKTSGRHKTREDIADYELQLAFYAIAHNELFGTDVRQGVILMSVDGGFPLEFKIDLFEGDIINRLLSRTLQHRALILQQLNRP